MDWFAETLRQYPEISIFLALALGYWIGGFRIGTFSLGSVAGTLLVGVLLGQMEIIISANVKATFFLMALFAVGYGVGPQFFRELKSDAMPQAIFAAVQCVVSLAAGYAVAKTFGYDVGQAAGLLAGSQTISALLGTATDAINKLAIPDDEKRRLIDAMPVAYAVTYIFGTAGTAWILSAVGPTLVGGNVVAACKQYETKPPRRAVLRSDGACDSRTLAALAAAPAIDHGGYVRKATRSGRPMPFTIHATLAHGAAVSLVGSRREPKRAERARADADGPPGTSSVMFVGAGITLGALLGALAIKVGEVPLSLSTSGGALIAGLVFGWLRSVHGSFGDVPEPALWMMNSVGLNIFIAVVGINSGPGFMTGLREVGLSLFLAGILVTAIPLVVGLLVARYVFGFHPGIALGCVAGARTTAAALTSIQDAVQSKVPALGYTVTYAVGNTLQTIWGIVIVMLMTPA